MSELAKTYEPSAVEAKWYEYWLQHGCFQADPARVSAQRPAYSIVIPPPNVTGVLTLGHVLNNTIQDILARRARMLGKEVLWLPGTDHAGIATQNVVEKSLRKAGEMKHRDDLGREALVAKIWEWKEKYGGIIIQQLKKLGASCDWSRERFTMDPAYSQCVSRVFVDLYKKGLIYRGKRMVNWCPASLTALSDEGSGDEGAERHNVLFQGGGGRVARHVAHHRHHPPRDHPRRYRRGRESEGRPLRPSHREARAPAPARAGSRRTEAHPHRRRRSCGLRVRHRCVKVTPAHDKADFEIGQRHKLPVVDVMNPDGTMNALAGESLANLDRFEARKVAAEHLRELGVLEKEEPHQNNVGFSERAGVPIEPRLSEQWFLKYPSVAEAKACVDDGRMRFFPERWAKVYDHWLEGIQDWCISRQLWWGHRVPVWSIELGGDEVVRRFPQLKSVMDVVLEKAASHTLTSVSGQPSESSTSFVSDWNMRDGDDIHGRIIQIADGHYRVEIASERTIFEDLGFTQDPRRPSTPGSAPGSGLSPRWAGREDRTLAKFYRRPISSPGRTSFSSGSRA
ncbi:MAG: class I tRNA ligase family protein [Chthoniobacter sp.]